MEEQEAASGKQGVKRCLSEIDFPSSQKIPKLIYEVPPNRSENAVENDAFTTGRKEDYATLEYSNNNVGFLGDEEQLASVSLTEKRSSVFKGREHHVQVSNIDIQKVGEINESGVLAEENEACESSQYEEVEIGTKNIVVQKADGEETVTTEKNKKSESEFETTTTEGGKRSEAEAEAEAEADAEPEAEAEAELTMTTLEEDKRSEVIGELESKTERDKKSGTEGEITPAEDVPGTSPENKLISEDKSEKEGEKPQNDSKADTGVLLTVSKSEWETNQGEYYYHYTTQDNLQSILNDKQINPSTPIYRGNLGLGVYATNLKPSTSDKDLGDELFLGGTSPRTLAKKRAFIALKRTDIMQYFNLVPYPRRDAFKIDTREPILLTQVRHYSSNR